MSQNKDFKRLVRARMAETGENYTQALTALLGETRLDPLPDGWFTAGSSPAEYAAGVLPTDSAYDGKRVIRLRFRATTPPGGFGTVMQSFDATRYRGRRVRFSALVRGQEITDWAGAWLRRPHTSLAWSVAAMLLIFSVLVSLIGATDPMPIGGYSRYTAASALRDLFKTPPPFEGTALADR